MIGGIRVNGVSGEELLDAFVQHWRSAAVEERVAGTIAERSVWTLPHRSPAISPSPHDWQAATSHCPSLAVRTMIPIQVHAHYQASGACNDSKTEQGSPSGWCD